MKCTSDKEVIICIENIHAKNSNLMGVSLKLKMLNDETRLQFEKLSRHNYKRIKKKKTHSPKSIDVKVYWLDCSHWFDQGLDGLVITYIPRDGGMIQ